MPWRVSDAKWLQTETDRVEEIILMPKFWHRRWTIRSLKVELADIGLEYSIPELRLINDELHVRGVVVDVGP